MNINFLAGLPPWDPYDSGNQVYWIEQLKTLLQNLDTQIEETQVLPVYLSQSAYPTQLDWENAYVAQTGKTLPIPPNALLQWWDTTNGVFAGTFGTLSNSNGTVFPRDNRYSPGQVVAYATAYSSIAGTTTTSIGTVSSAHPSVSLTLKVPARITLTYSLVTALTASSGSWGADFLLNGLKVGSTYYNVASNRGLIETTATGLLLAEAVTPIMPAGTYTVQALMGVTSGTPTVAFGGVVGSPAYGARILVAKATTE